MIDIAAMVTLSLQENCARNAYSNILVFSLQASLHTMLYIHNYIYTTIITVVQYTSQPSQCKHAVLGKYYADRLLFSHGNDLHEP